MLVGVAASKSDKEIGAELNTSRRSVGSAVSRIRIKLGVTGGRVDIIAAAIDQGIL